MRRALKELQVDKSLLISKCMNNVIFLYNHFHQINVLTRRWVTWVRRNLARWKRGGWPDVKWRLLSRAALKTDTYCNSCWFLLFPTGFNCFTLQLSIQSEAVFIIGSLSLTEFIFLWGEFFVLSLVSPAESHMEVSQLFVLHISRLRLKMGFPLVCNQITA